MQTTTPCAASLFRVSAALALSGSTQLPGWEDSADRHWLSWPRTHGGPLDSSGSAPRWYHACLRQELCPSEVTVLVALLETLHPVYEPPAVEAPRSSARRNTEGGHLKTSWIKLVTDWNVPRLLYLSYRLIERLFRIDALRAQIAAGAFMRVFGSFIFATPAFLSPLVSGRPALPGTRLERSHALAQ